MPDDHIINIIAKDLRGGATTEEMALLQQWLEADPVNRQEYEELAAVWKGSGQLIAGQTFPTDAAWAKLTAKAMARPTAVDEDNAPARKVNLFAGLYRKRAMLAAAVIAVFIIGGFLWNHYRTAWQELTAENNQSLHLPDGSTVQLRKGASIRYPLRFEGTERLVRLSGEAFFNIQRNEHQPFIILTGNAAVKVLGTSFLVNAAKEKDEVIVMTGKVSVASNKEAGRQVELVAGQRTVLQNDQFLQSQVTDSNFIAWNTGLLDFKNAPLEKVLEDLHDYYEVPIGLDSGQQATLSTLGVTVRFDHQPLDQALEEIRLVTGLSMKKEGSKIVFYMK